MSFKRFWITILCKGCNAITKNKFWLNINLVVENFNVAVTNDLFPLITFKSFHLVVKQYSFGIGPNYVTAY